MSTGEPLDLDVAADEALAETAEPLRIVKAAALMRARTGLGLREIVPILRRAEDRAAGRPTCTALLEERDNLRAERDRLRDELGAALEQIHMLRGGS